MILWRSKITNNHIHQLPYGIGRYIFLMLPIYIDLVVSFSLGADVLAPDSLRPNLMAALVLVYRPSQKILVPS
jgi:hypothetical protein